MGVYIHGMEMPKNCGECFAYKAELSQEKKVIYVCCFTREEYVPNENRVGTDCPLIAVPPHGRLIDADAEIARVQNLYNKAVAKDPEMGCVSVYEGEIAVLKLAPTIIPASGGKENE